MWTVNGSTRVKVDSEEECLPEKREFVNLAVRRWKQLTEEELPRKAAAEKWMLRFDHCFKRVTLDHVFQDVWYKHLHAPAETHLSVEQAAKAVAIAEQILHGGPEVLKTLNRSSLQWRGKLRSSR